MKRQHLNYYQTEAAQAFRIAASLQWSDSRLALEWHCYALDCQRIAQQIQTTPAREYVALVIANETPQTAQLSMF